MAAVKRPRFRRGTDPKLDRFAQLQLFAGCSKSDLAKIARLTVEVNVPAGKVLAREGEPGHEFFVIEEGTATATLRGGETARMGPGECFGELALLNRAPRAATVQAETEMRLVVLDAREFANLIDDVPRVARSVMAAVAERLESAESPRPHH
jgi:CRP-like cAMP-binding protein